MYRQLPAAMELADIITFAMLGVVFTGELPFNAETRVTSRRRKSLPCYRNTEVYLEVLAAKPRKAPSYRYRRRCVAEF